MRVLNRYGVDPVDVVAQEWAHMSFARRWVLRWVSPSLAQAARELARQPRGYVNVPMAPRQKGPFEKWADDLLGK